jgi:hypothetical protein
MLSSRKFHAEYSKVFQTIKSSKTWLDHRPILEAQKFHMALAMHEFHRWVANQSELVLEAFTVFF